MLCLLHCLLAIAGISHAATINITVGEGASLKFNPDSVTAAVGDVLEFHFYPGSGAHSVVSGPFATPCQPANDSFFSDYINVPRTDESGDMVFSTTVNSTGPIWFYCSLGSHCQEGMVGVVNPPADQSITDYMNAAMAFQGKASAPTARQGGMFSSGMGDMMSSTMSSIMGSGGVAGGGTTSTSLVQDGPTGRVTSGSSVGFASTYTAPTTASITALSGTSQSSLSSNPGGAMSSKASPSLTEGGASVTSTASSASSASAATTTSVGNARKSEMSVVLGLAGIAGVLVALMA